MRSKLCVSGLMLLLMLCISVSISAYSVPEIVEKDGVLWAGKGWAVEQDGIRVLYLSGSPLEIGIQHGLLSVDDPDKMLEVWQSLDPAYHAEGFERIAWFFRNLYARFQFYPVFKRHTPDEYFQEMKGFILGASRGEDSSTYDIMMSNASQDLALTGQACSAFAAWGEATADGHLYLGRNLDHSGMIPMAQFQYLAFYNPDEGHPFVVHNYPSHVGTMSGMNSEGIVITSNYSIAVPQETTIFGLPYMLVVRKALQYSSTIEEALEIILNSPRTVGLNLMVADKERAVVVELTAYRMVVREAENAIYSTNQFQNPYMKQFQATGWMASALRDQRFEELINGNWGKIDVSLARDFMRDRFDPGSSANLGFVSGIHTDSNLASMVFVPGKSQVWLGRLGDIEARAPYAADGAFIGFDAHAIWQTGLPQPPIGVLPPTPQEGFYEDWFSVFDAIYLRYLGEFEEALEMLEDVLSRHPDAEMPLYWAGRMNIHLGNLDEAFEYLQEYLELETHNEPFYLFLAKVWSAVILDTWGKRDEALRLYKSSLEVEIEDMPGELTGFRQTATQGLQFPLYVDDAGQVGRQ